MVVSYSVSDIKDYINWVYFFHAWGFGMKYSRIALVHGCDACRRSWVDSFNASERPRAEEALRLYKDANAELSRMSNFVSAKGKVKLFRCYSHEDDIILLLDSGEEFQLPMLRSLHPDKEGFCLCLSDFIHENIEDGDMVGVFATTVSNTPPPVSASGSVRQHKDTIMSDDDYHALLTQTLADRLAEAAAERLHQQVRTDFWGYCPDEALSIADLHAERFQGIRPAVGYPCMPDVSLNFLIDELLDFNSLGISLTENAMMVPHASVSGLMMSNENARYFDIGDISAEQLEDYARRRNLSAEMVKRFLRVLR